MESLRFALQREHLAFFGPSREESILDRACCRSKIYMSYKRRFFAAHALQSRGYPLAARTGGLKHNIIGAFWTYVQIDHGEYANHDQQNGCKGQRTQDHLSCERVFNPDGNLHRSYSAVRSRIMRQSSLLPAP